MMPGRPLRGQLSSHRRGKWDGVMESECRLAGGCLVRCELKRSPETCGLPYGDSEYGSMLWLATTLQSLRQEPLLGLSPSPGSLSEQGRCLIHSPCRSPVHLCWGPVWTWKGFWAQCRCKRAFDWQCHPDARRVP